MLTAEISTVCYWSAWITIPPVRLRLPGIPSVSVSDAYCTVDQFSRCLRCWHLFTLSFNDWLSVCTNFL